MSRRVTHPAAIEAVSPSRTGRSGQSDAPGRLTALLLALLLPGMASAQSNAGPTEYRVELLVVEPVDPRSDAWPIDEAVRFDTAVDPGMARRLADAMVAGWSAIDAVTPAIGRPPAPRIGLLPPPDEAAGTAGETEPEPVTRPWAFIGLDPLPASLSAARERLERTGEFSVVAAQAWIQPSGSPRRPLPVRVHDDVTILRERVEEPDTGPGDDESPTLPGARRDAPLSTSPGPRFAEAANETASSATGVQEGPGTALAEADREEWTPRRPDPVPKVSARLDGTVALVRRQFLHADLDLHWRNPVERPAIGTGSIDGADAPFRFEVHRLQQSRVIRPDRWEYFDSARFGVLLHVTELEPLRPLPPPEPVQATIPSEAGLPEAGPGPGR